MRLTFEEYQRRAVRTAAPMPTGVDEIDRGVYGLIGELGELAEIIKKARYQGHPMDWAAIREELGDILWYWTVLCNDLDYGAESIAAANLAKLEERYPGGFDAGRSVLRG